MNARIFITVFILCTAIMATCIKALAIPYSPPPDWMPMTMLSITFDPAGNKLAITPTTFAAPLSTNTNMVGMPAAGVAGFDPAQPYAVLNGTAFSRRFGWWDPNEMSATPLLTTVRAFYGPDANIWIRSLAKSPGLNTYQAVGADGMQTGNTYPGIFGTAGSAPIWLWDGKMDHNTYAVPFSFLTKPNQFFSAYYKIYVGDASGNELLVNGTGAPVASAATTTTWGWQGPPFVFTSQTASATGITVESDVYTHTDAAAPVSITGGEYALSTDGGLSWGPWTSTPGTIHSNDRIKVRQTSAPTAGTTTTVVLTIPTATGPGTFSVTTLGPISTPTAFSFSSQTGVATSTAIESSSITVAGINTGAAISISAGGEYAVSSDGGATWSDWSSTVPATIGNGSMVKVRLLSSAAPGTTTATTLTIGGVSAAFVVTTGNPVTPQLFFTPVTGAPANTSVSGMPFYATSNAIAATADSAISVSGGISPQYQVSTDNGVSWSGWSITAPATVTAGTLVRVRAVPATTPFTTTVTKLTMGSTVAGFSITTGYMNPPSWMPMAMLNVAFNPDTATLSVQDLHSHPSFPGATIPALTYVPAASYDPAAPWSVLNTGVAISRQLGWDDSTALHGNGITVPGNLLNQVKAAYGATAGIWIECTAKSPGLETYFADGMFGVGGTGNSASGTPQVYSNPTTGLPIIYENNYFGIFGTQGSAPRWQWDGTMIHNVHAVPTQFITEPNQVFTATYRVYIGDDAGNDLAPEAATTEVWSWKGPATVPDAVPDVFTFGAKTAAPPNSSVESDPVAVSGLTVTSPIAVTGGEYAVSADNGATWSPFSTVSPLVVANGNLVKVRLTTPATAYSTTAAILTIGGVTGIFSVTTSPPVPDGNSAVTAMVSGPGGTITPSGIIVKNGAQPVFTVKAEFGYEIASITGCGGTLSGTHYKTGPVTSNCTIAAVFSATPPELVIKSKPVKAGYPGKNGVVNFTVTGVTSQEELAATVSTSAPWLTAGPLVYANGKGRLAYSISENPGSAPRTGSMTIFGQSFAISQSARPVKLAVTPATVRFAAEGGSAEVAVTIEPNDASWSISTVKWVPESSQGWLGGFAVAEPHTGPATLTFTVATNGSGKQRSALLTVQSSDGKKRKIIKVIQAR